MELGLVVKQAVAATATATAAAKADAIPARTLGFRDSPRIGPRRVRFQPPASGAWRNRAVRAACDGSSRPEAVVHEIAKATAKNEAKPARLYVGLPLDAVSAGNVVTHGKAIAAGMRALALLGVDGVDLPISWGVFSNSGGDWSSYLAVAAMARDAGLRLRVSLHLHAHGRPQFPLPQLVERAVAADPDILFTDRSGGRHRECLSFAVDELPVLDGKTPLEAFEEFFQSFRVAFTDLMNSTITDITVGLGPNGELRYPSFPSSGGKSSTGVGEFQCYDKYMMADLKRCAEEAGSPLWGLSGPHDAPAYDRSPDSGTFFKDHGGSWETPYGQFFLSWYSGKLLSHADLVLSVASKVFGDFPLSAKVPLVHWWHNTRSRPSQLTTGYYNAEGRDGYEAVAEIFAKHSCAMIVPGIDLSDAEQPQGARSSPESLLTQIIRACKKQGVRISSENSSIVGVGSVGFSKIKEKIMGEISGLDSFTYNRMGAEFFSPEHWPLFTQFILSMSLPEMDPDDIPTDEETLSLPMKSVAEKDRQMQAV
ncbi:inactive beta-amylase 9-like [Zingiber officinale]|uniref:Beta-amylase n=1 Tax=Zingiber officinale TaxID=94328 RepID=A0A8J5FKU8_ZINOF|nr:inactive beta-amylase 9-like [Zingiber officinale]KAG6486343.1 hypothetical protein ZIOFF_054913 [Zingiber officinale]